MKTKRVVVFLVSAVVAILAVPIRAEAHYGASGWLDSAGMTGPGRLTVSGWAVSFGHPGVSLGALVTINGERTDDYYFYANNLRADVGAVYGSWANYSGYQKTIAVKSRGIVLVCVWAQDDGIYSQLNGCRSVDTDTYSDVANPGDAKSQFFGDSFYRVNSDIPLTYSRLNSGSMNANEFARIGDGMALWPAAIGPRSSVSYDFNNTSQYFKISFNKATSLPGIVAVARIFYFLNCPTLDALYTPKTSAVSDSCASWGVQIDFNDLTVGNTFPVAAQSMVVAHEVGHALGLTHTAQWSIMRPGNYYPNAPLTPTATYDLGAIDAKLLPPIFLGERMKKLARLSITGLSRHIGFKRG